MYSITNEDMLVNKAHPPPTIRHRDVYKSDDRTYLMIDRLILFLFFKDFIIIMLTLLMWGRQIIGFAPGAETPSEAPEYSRAKNKISQNGENELAFYECQKNKVLILFNHLSINHLVVIIKTISLMIIITKL